ncbi:hypothetical protein CXB51_004205 [Gossypium anomalum]|uniref:Leucine-rich repeat-containing N-terminal plant-type domain-containing protein n=1 Tax=Gossypium anomalum TaxID=47600 RepID=A0A8J5ZFI6_9ROSI|nr:hypothetical protein CXB51_004205 [Gossypium anomalum]
MRTSALVSWLFFYSYVATVFRIKVVSVSGQCQSDQQELLLGLKNSLNSSSSEKLLKWNQSTDCCSWDGITCNADGQVIGLDLSKQLTSGAIDKSNSLFHLRHLQQLNLAYNSFKSKFPSGFENLANLRYLNLSNAGFTGQIPVGISYMTKLVTMDLSKSWLLDLGSLKLKKPNLVMLVQNLTRLQNLYLDGINISADRNKWSQALSSSLPDLQVLSMSRCHLSGPINPSLAKLKSLSIIRLDTNNLFGPVPKFFAEFQDLTSLHLAGNNLSGRVPKEILQAPKLQTLDLSFNNLLQGSFIRFPPNASLQSLLIPESIGNLGQLTRIELINCKFNGPLPKTLEKLTQLVYLDFSSNNFSGPVPSFTTLKALTHLNLAGNKLNGSILSTNWSSLLNLVSLDLARNSFSGTVLPTLFQSQSLKGIYLPQNQFTGGFSEVKGEFSSLLQAIDLSRNRLQGPFPMFVFEIQGLCVLSLSCNKFSGLIPLSAFHKLKNLSNLDLSYNNLSFDSSFINLMLPPFLSNISVLKLASCNLTKFPDFLKNLSILDHLDLSKNRIHGQIPSWIWKSPYLSYLNLSLNFLVEFERPSSINSLLLVIDLHGNQLQGQKPIFPPQVVYLDYSSNNFSSVLPHEIGDFLQTAAFFSLSGNNFHGSIPKSICQASSLLVLDLSNNSLSGSVPECLIQMSVSLGVLNLKQNNFSSNIPDTFPENCVLQTLDLNRNRLGGKVPKSLVKCRMLEVLDLGNDQIDDTFPCHLKSTSRLHIIDLASNSFDGKLPQGFLMTWNAMMTEKDDPYSEILHFEVLKLSELSFQDSMTVTMKGQELELVKILTIFTSIDFSSNKFEGPIPEAMGDFRALHLLNLSNNALTGTVPSFLGNLLKLEALDLSSNHLIGQIPLQLANLNFLSFLNLSNNELIGKIPLGTQIQSFPEASFENNAGLCGLPLRAPCESPPVTKVGPSNPRTGNHINWDLISVEIGFVFGLGAVIVPLMFWKRWRIWYFKHIDRVLFKFFPKLDHRNRNHRTIAQWIQGRRL